MLKQDEMGFANEFLILKEWKKVKDHELLILSIQGTVFPTHRVVGTNEVFNQYKALALFRSETEFNFPRYKERVAQIGFFWVTQAILVLLF